MKLTNKQKQLVIKKLDGIHSCPACGNHQLAISDTLFEVREINGGNLVIGGNSSIYPLLALSCSACGHTLFFNAILLGIISTDTKQSEPDNDKK